MSPLIGLYDDDMVPYDWDEIIAGDGEFTDPPPVLLSLYPDRTSYCDFSATELLDDPYQVQMRRRIEYYDTCDRTHDAILGTMAHSHLEAMMEKLQSHGATLEQRLSQEVTVKVGPKASASAKVGGTPDFHQDGVLWDYKTISQAASDYMRKGRSDKKKKWGQQLSIYRWLLHKHGVKINNAFIRVIIKDWRNYEFKRKNCDLTAYPKGYRLEIKMMSVKKTEEFVRERVKLHLQAQRLSDKQLFKAGECDTWNGIRCKDWCSFSDVCYFRLRDKKMGRKPNKKRG